MRKPRVRTKLASPSSALAEAPLPDPYVVRYGPWAFDRRSIG